MHVRVLNSGSFPISFPESVFVTLLPFFSYNIYLLKSPHIPNQQVGEYIHTHTGSGDLHQSEGTGGRRFERSLYESGILVGLIVSLWLCLG